MSQKSLFAKVSADFDPASPEGALVLCDSFKVGRYFSEDGYDGGEQEDRRIVEVRPAYSNAADDDALNEILDGLGIEPSDPNDDTDDNILPNVVCRNPAVRAALEAAGYDAVVTDSGIIDGGGQYGATILWKPGTFEVLPKRDILPFSVAFGDEGVCLTVNTPEGAQTLLEMNRSLIGTSVILSRLIAATAAAGGHLGIAPLDPESIDREDGTLVLARHPNFSVSGELFSADTLWVLDAEDLNDAVYDLLAREPFVVPVDPDFAPASGHRP